MKKVFLGIAIVLAIPSAGLADQVASEERAAAAVGHYARARAMVVEALAEFEEGRKLAQPDILVDPESWRLSVISRTEDLNRLLDPQPRVTRSGVRFNSSSLRVRREKEQPAVPADGPKASNVAAEDLQQAGESEQTSEKIRPAREAVISIKPKASVKEKTITSVQDEVVKEETSEEPLKTEGSQSERPVAKAPSSGENSNADPEVQKEIEDVIKEQLERISRSEAEANGINPDDPNSLPDNLGAENFGKGSTGH